jgi:predicted kinase
MNMPLDYPSILKQRIAAGEITVHDATSGSWATA